MSDRSVQVKKKAIAALGEYMFYAATQLDDELGAETCWEISDDAIQVMARSLEDGDETVRFYSSKTIENITAQSLRAGIRFAD